MDFSAFGDENWEVKKWLNSAFSEISKEKRDTHAATLLTKLQLVSQGNHIPYTCNLYRIIFMQILPVQ